LPGMIFGHRTEQVHGVLGLRGDEFTRIHVAAIHQMAGWQAVVRRQVFVDGRERVPIRQRRIRRLDVGDEPRQVGVTGFGEVRFVTAPFGLPLAAIARFDVIRRDDALSVGGISLSVRQRHCAPSKQNCCSQTSRKVASAGTSLSQAGALAALHHANTSAPSAAICCAKARRSASWWGCGP